MAEVQHDPLSRTTRVWGWAVSSGTPAIGAARGARSTVKELLGARTGLVIAVASLGTGPSRCGHRGDGYQPPT